MNMNFTLRPIEKRDNAELAQLIRGVFEEHDAPTEGTVYTDPTTDDLFGLFKEASSHLWVALVDDQIVGCCGIYPTAGLPEHCIELVKFYITKNARGLGIGKALMGACTEIAIASGYTQMYIESLPVFSKAVRIYEQQGFFILDKPLGQTGHSGCNIWMLKNLDPKE
jgi:putative acetyltransferase